MSKQIFLILVCLFPLLATATDYSAANTAKSKQEYHKLMRAFEQKIKSIIHDEMFQKYHVGARLPADYLKQLRIIDRDKVTGNRVYILNEAMKITITVGDTREVYLAQFDSRYPTSLERIGVVVNMHSGLLKKILKMNGYTLIQEDAKEIICVKGDFQYIFSMEDDQLFNLIVTINDPSIK